MKRKRICDVNPGDIFTYAGEEFVILEHFKEGVLVLAKDNVDESVFNRSDADCMNDYRESVLEEAVQNFVDKLCKNGAVTDDMVDMEVDLRPTDMSDGYGLHCTIAAPLTLWQYGKYKDIIPFTDRAWWIITPVWTKWLRSPCTDSTDYAWVVRSDGGCGYGYCSDSYGVRPALMLKSDLFVSFEGDDDDTQDENTEVNLRDVSTTDLLKELMRRNEEKDCEVVYESI